LFYALISEYIEKLNCLHFNKNVRIPLPPDWRAGNIEPVVFPFCIPGAGEAEERGPEERGSGEEGFGEEERGSGRGAEAPREAEAGAAALGQRVSGQRETTGRPREASRPPCRLFL